MPGGAEWLALNYRTLFRLRRDGRIESEHDPDRSPGPRFWLAGCGEGNVFGVRSDVPDAIAAELMALAADEPPFIHPATPKFLDRYLAVLADPGSPPPHNLGLIYDLPHGLPMPSDVAPARLVDGDSSAGRELAQVIALEGMPPHLSELGFRSIADFWPPWCVAIIENKIAAIAFSARLCALGAGLGIVTARAFRGRGLAATATAGWSRLAALQSRTLFYSTDLKNRSSQRVTARLGLQLRGASLRIT